MATSSSRAPAPSRLFMLPRDIGLFLRSARTDKAIARTRARDGARAAFEEAYSTDRDPWASANPRYRYQRNKYAGLMSFLPRGRRFGRALDLGCGGGVLSEMLAGVADDVLGLDIAQAAVDHARIDAEARRQARGAGDDLGTLSFEQGDVTDLPASLEARFDLVVVADTIYYLDHTDDAALARVARTVASLVAPGGLCMVANHYFFAADKDSRLSRRIHDAFLALQPLQLVSQHRRAFYLATLLAKPMVALPFAAPG